MIFSVTWMVMNWEGTGMSFWGPETRTRMNMCRSNNETTESKTIICRTGSEQCLLHCGVTNHIHQANSSLPNISYSDKLSHLLQLVTCELCNVTRDLSLVPASSALHTSYIRLSVAKSKNDPGGTAWFLSSEDAVGQSCISLGGSRGRRCPSQIAHCLSGNKANWNLVSRFLNECMGCQGVVQSWRAPSRRRFWTQVISPAGLCVLMLSPRITLTRGMTNTTLLPGECHCNLAFMVVLFNRDSKLSIRMLNWALTVCVNFG